MLRSRIRRAVVCAVLLACFEGGPGRAADEEDDPFAGPPPAPAAALRAFALVRPGDIVAREEALARQIARQYRPILDAELAFIRTVADLSPEQRPRIKAAGEASLLEAAKALAEARGNNMRGVGVVVNPPPGDAPKADPTTDDPRSIIAAGLTKALRETLTPEQMKRFSDLYARRSATRERAIILFVVARLDSELFLSAAQRDKIIEALSSHWRNSWESWRALQNMGGVCFPQIPDDCVVPHLNSEQATLWHGAQKVTFAGHNGNSVALPDDAAWWGGKPDAAADDPLAD